MAALHFTPLPILTTERLTLRQLCVEDHPAILAMRSNPEVNKYLDREPSQTPEDAIRFINQVNENIQTNSALYWGITLTGTHTLVGIICLFQFAANNTSCEIGYELLPAFQGQGIMQEAAATVIGYAFNALHIQQIKAFTHPNNQASARLLQKLQFVQSAAPNTENDGLLGFTLLS